jgi:hypothetical protein
VTCCTLIHASTNSVEYKIKVGLIFKLLHFITWPETTLGKKGKPLLLCILGKDPFGKEIDVLSSRIIKGHPINIHRIQNYTKQACHILFISSSKKHIYPTILPQIKNQPILTLSDMNHFAKKGGMIEIGKKKKRFSFFINYKKVKKSHLKISATLLQIATIVS